MSSRIFQGVVDQLSAASQSCVGVIDAEGTVISAGEGALSAGRRLPQQSRQCRKTLLQWTAGPLWR